MIYEAYPDELYHHGIQGMRWGIRLGPPYPLSQQAKAVKKLAGDLDKIGYKEFTRLMSPQEVVRMKAGSCHDQVLYEYNFLKKNGLAPKAHFFIETDDRGQGGQTHSMVYFQLNKKFIWIENAWEDQKGLHSYSSEESLLTDVRKRWGTSSEFPNIYDGDLDCEKLRPGMDLQEIVDVADF